MDGSRPRKSTNSTIGSWEPPCGWENMTDGWGRHGADRVFLKTPSDIPYRALLPVKMDNLLVAGRCLSADRQALASLRVMASCMGTGQAAGVAAAQSVASRRPVQEIDTARLVSTLKDLGAVL